MADPNSTVSLSHPSLDASLTGVKIVRDGIEVNQYRGLQYARIARRFAKPEIVGVGDAAERNRTKDGRVEVDATAFG